MAGTSLPRVDGDVPLVKHIKPLAARARLFPCANSAANKTKRSRRDRAPVLVTLAAITFITTYLVCWVALSVYGSRPENRPTNWLYFGRGRGPTRYQQGAHRPTDAQKQRGLVVAEESRRDEGDELAAYRAFSPKFGVIRMGDTRDSETWSGFHHKHDHGKEFQGEDSPGSTHVDSSPVDGVIAQPVRAPGIFSVTVSRFRIIAGSNRGNKLVNSWKHSIVLPRPDKADGLALDPSEVQQSEHHGQLDHSPPKYDFPSWSVRPIIMDTASTWPDGEALRYRGGIKHDERSIFDNYPLFHEHVGELTTNLPGELFIPNDTTATNVDHVEGRSEEKGANMNETENEPTETNEIGARDPSQHVGSSQE